MKRKPRVRQGVKKKKKQEADEGVPDSNALADEINKEWVSRYFEKGIGVSWLTVEGSGRKLGGKSGSSGGKLRMDTLTD